MNWLCKLGLHVWDKFERETVTFEHLKPKRRQTVLIRKCKKCHLEEARRLDAK
jgi:hypothetical protein